MPAVACKFLANISLIRQTISRTAYKCLALLQDLTTAFARVSEGSVSTGVAMEGYTTTHITSSPSIGDSGPYTPGDSTCAISIVFSTRSARRWIARGDEDAVDKDAEEATAGVTACKAAYAQARRGRRVILRLEGMKSSPLLIHHHASALSSDAHSRPATMKSSTTRPAVHLQTMLMRADMERARG